LADLAPADVDALVQEICHAPGAIVEECPDLTMWECLEQRKVATCAGLDQWDDCMAAGEPLRFLI